MTEIVEKIKADQEKEGALFILKRNPADLKSEDLTTAEILPVYQSSIQDPNKLAEQFTMILPLRNPISVK